jgi:hypothetical protein
MDENKFKKIAYEELVSGLEEIVENYIEEYKQALINEQMEVIAKEFKEENNMPLGIKIESKVRTKQEIERDMKFFVEKKTLLIKQQEKFLQE